MPSIDLEMSQQTLEEGQKITTTENNFVDFESSDSGSKPKMWDKNRKFIFEGKVFPDNFKLNFNVFLLWSGEKFPSKVI